MAIEIVDLSIKKGGFPLQTVNLLEGSLNIHIIIPWLSQY